MLVGIDYNHSFFLDEIIKGNENDTVAINFYPGQIVSGFLSQVRFPIDNEANTFFVEYVPLSEI